MTKASRRDRNELKAGAALSYLVIALQFVVALVYTPVMLRLLGQAEFGLYSLAAAIVGYLALISFGFSGAYLRFHARFHSVGDEEGVARLNGLFLIVFSAMGLIASGGGVALTLNVGAVLGGEFTVSDIETARVLFAILVANLAVTFPATVFNSYILAHERFVFQKLLQVVGSLLGPLATLPILFMGYGSIGMAATTTSVSIALTLCTVAYCLHHLKMRFLFRRLNFALLREISVFSSYLFINMLVDQVNWTVDKFIVGRFRGAISVAIYGVAGIFVANYMGFSTAISAVFAPRVNAMVASSRSDLEMTELFTRVGRVQFLVLGLILSGFVFFGRPVIELWAGADYRDAYPIALLLMVPVTVPMIQNLAIEIQKARNLHQFRSWVYLAVAIGNVSLSIPLTQQYGPIGAAAGTGVALLVGNGLVMNWHYQARLHLDIQNFWRQIVRLSLGMLPAVVAGILISSAVDLLNLPLLLISGAAYVGVYVAGAWWLGMNDYERRLFGAPISRILQSARRG